MRISDVPPVAAYIEDVRSGEFQVCQEQLALCELVEKTLADRDLRFDAGQYERYMKLQRYFPYRLFPWEEFLFALNNCIYRPGDLLRFPNLLALIGRGAGKNGYISFETMAHTTKINGVREYHIDIFAASEDQAKTSPEQIRGVLERNRLQRAFRWNKEEILNISTGSKIRYRTSNFKTKDGGQPGEVVFDEYHAFENYNLITVATTGLGKKRYPRQRIFTTDGNVRDGALDSEKSIAEDVLFKGMDDLGNLPFICRLNDPEQVHEKANWFMANPSLRYFPTLYEEIEREYEKFKRDPAKSSDFLTKRMNMPPRTKVNDVTAWENLLAASRPLPDLTGRDCVVGIDYAKTSDFVAAGLPFCVDGVYYWITHSWVCAQSPNLGRIKAPLRDWETQGLLTFVNAVEIPPELPLEWVAEQAQRYDLRLFGMDNFRITLFRSAMKKYGFDPDDKNRVRLVKRVTVMRHAPVIQSAFNNQIICWGDNPLMRWYTNNTYTEMDKNGNITFQKKEQKSRMTDGFMAMVAAFGAGYEFENDHSGDIEEIATFDY